MLAGAVVQEGQRASMFAANGQAQRLMLSSALARAGARATDLVWVECAALANPWGDPIELGALTAELTAHARLAAGNVKGSSAHTEIPSGLVALLMLQLKLQSTSTTPNAQLRVVNPHALSTL